MAGDPFNTPRLKLLNELRKKCREHPWVLVGKPEWRPHFDPEAATRDAYLQENLPEDSNVIFEDFGDGYPPDYRELDVELSKCFDSLTDEERKLDSVEAIENSMADIEASQDDIEAFGRIDELEEIRDELRYPIVQVKIDALIQRLEAVSPEAQEQLRLLAKKIGESWLNEE